MAGSAVITSSGDAPVKVPVESDQPVKVYCVLVHPAGCTTSIFNVCLLPCGHMKLTGWLNFCPST